MNRLPALVGSSDRFFSLDVLRGLAAFLVLWRHMPIKPRMAMGGGEYFAEVIFHIGWCGVDLFYVLSGFLISNLLFQEFKETGRLHVGRFWLRRGMKIWPSYFCAYGVMLALNVAYAWWTADAASVHQYLRTILPNTLFIQNYAHYSVRWDNSWSIAIEEHFYLMLPLLLLGLAAGQRFRGVAEPCDWFRSLPWLGLGLATVLLSARFYLAMRGARWGQVYYPTHLRIDSLFCGVVIGYAWNYHRQWIKDSATRWRWGLPFVFAAVAWLHVWPLETSWQTYSLGFVALYLAFGGVVIVAVAHPELGGRGVAALPGRFFAWMGVYSYTIYLAHSVVYDLPGVGVMRRAIVASAGGSTTAAGIWVDRLLFVAMSIGGGVILAKAVEQPCLRLRKRWFPSRARFTSLAPSQQTDAAAETAGARRRAAA